MKFVGRREELSRLEILYAREGSMNCAVYGRRRVGKTSLIQEFCRGKRTLYLTSPSKDRETIFGSYSATLSSFLGHEAEVGDGSDLVGYLTEAVSSGGKTVVVMDEFPFLVGACPDFPALLYGFMSTVMNVHPSMLVIAGSSVGTMSWLLNDTGSPLFSRFNLQINLRPLEYREARLLNPGLSEEDRMRVYAIAGGVPMYHLMLDGDPEETVSSQLLDPSGGLGKEAETVFSVELEPWEEYSEVLDAMAPGGSDIYVIMEYTGKSRAECLKALGDLRAQGAVSDENPYDMKRKTVYRISDGLMDFWYSVVRRHADELSGCSGNPYAVLHGYIESFYGRRFEIVCRQYLASTRRCSWVGKWWGDVPLLCGKKHQRDSNGKVIMRGREIDVVAAESGSSAEYLVMCACRFADRQMDVVDFEALLSDSVFVKRYALRRFAMFSRPGFTPELLKAAEDSDAQTELVDMERLVSWAEGH